MKLFILPAILALTMAAASCGNTESGSGTTADSTMQSGAAPGEYHTGAAGAPVDTSTPGSEQFTSDTAGLAPGAAGGPFPSNTTDRKTTSGSEAGSSNNPPVK